MVAGLVWTAAKVAVPRLVGEAIDDGVAVADRSAVVRYAWMIAGVGLVAAVFTGLRRYLAFREARWIEADLRLELFTHLQRLHVGFHDRNQTGQLMSRANTDLQQIQNVVVLVPLTISNLATVAAVVVLLVSIDPLLTVLALGSLPAMNVLTKRFSTNLHRPLMAVQEESAELATVVEETVSGIRAVKGFGAEADRSTRLAVEADDIYRESMASAQVRATYQPALELLPSLGLIAVLGYGGHQVVNGDLALGSLVAFNAYVVLLVWPLRMLGWVVAMAQRAAASAQRVHEVLDTTPLIVDPDVPERLPESGGEVRFDDVTLPYRSIGPLVLDHLDLVIPAGQSVAIVGETASGKSTIARLLSRLYDVDGGALSLDGHDIRHLELAELRHAVGMVFEDTFLFSDTIAANIAFADPHAPHDVIVGAARSAGAHDFIEALPAGYDTLIGERGYSLSGGQRQRIAIARAILADPRVLVLDDATSAVDPSKEHEIREALSGVMGGRTTVVIAHRPATIALAERVVLLGDGKVVADGTHEDLLATEPRYRSVLAAWARAEEDGDADRGGVDGDRNVGGVDEDVDGVAGYGGAGDGIDDVEGIEGIEGALR